MVVATASFNDLPNELISKICVDLPAPSVVALSTLNRRLFEVCNDAITYQRVIESHDGLRDLHAFNLDRIAARLRKDQKVLTKYHFFDLDLRRIWRWHTKSFTAALRERFGFELEPWRRYAWADERAYLLCLAFDQPLVGRMFSPSQLELQRNLIRDGRDYLPYLFILMHPSANAVGLPPAIMAEMIADIRDDYVHINTFAPPPPPSDEPKTMDPSLAFCFCTTVLSQDSPELPSIRDHRDPKQTMEYNFNEQCDQFHSLALPRRRHSSNSAPHDVSADHDITSSTALQATGQFLIGCFAVLLRRAFREYNVRRLIGTEYYTFTLPFAHDIPLETDSLRSAPPVPYLDDFAAWQGRHVTSIATPEYICDSEWVGFYSTNNNGKTPDFDAPMVGMQFQIRSTSDESNLDSSAPRRVYATGLDSIGPFTLTGHMRSVGAGSGTVLTLQKAYLGGHTWLWRLIVSSFGLVGVWGPASSSKPLGAVWLWKTNWVQRD